MVQSGDPTATGKGGESVFGIVKRSSQYRYFASEITPKLKHKERGTVSMVSAGEGISGSQFFITTGDELDYLDGKHAVFGHVAEGMEVIDEINSSLCDEKGRPYRDVRIKHTVILEDPYDDPEGLQVPDASPLPTKEQLETVRIGADEELQEDITEEEQEQRRREAEAKAQALTLEMVGDLPHAEVRPPENVLFVCKLNPVTRDEDLELIFSRFGEVVSCEVIRDQKTGDSLQYAFVEFDKKDDCEAAYFKMQGVLIDDRRIHVDFSQSVSKLQSDWREKTSRKRGVAGSDSNGALRNGRTDGYDIVLDPKKVARHRDSDRRSNGDYRDRHGDRRHDDRRDRRRDDRDDGHRSDRHHRDKYRDDRRRRERDHRRSRSRSRSRSPRRDRDRERHRR